MAESSKEEYFKKYERDSIEMGRDQMVKVDFPKPISKYRLVYESYQLSMEETYFWLLDYLRDGMGFPLVEKITDVFTASENSAFFGVQQQRLGLQQDKVSQFLATIGKMVKELFQLVREMRILDERLSYYEDSYTDSPSSESAEITLKGIYVDMAEGGSKNPSSVYGMSRELQFTTLPDLFFSIHPKTSRDIDVVVDKLEFNRKVKEVLKRKLRSYLEWKEHTFKEMKNRRWFTLKFLRQHYVIIKMYTDWVKPYLRNIRRLTQDARKTETPDLITAFEGSMIEVEFIAKRIPEGNKKYQSCICIHIDYRTRPSLNYQQEGFQRGPIHVGRAEVTFRCYGWSDDELAAYKKMREQEGLELLGEIDGSVRAAMTALGDELQRYLEEAGETFATKEFKKEAPKESSPFVSVGKGFAELFTAFRTPKELKQKKPKTSRQDAFKEKKEKGKAEKEAKGFMWTTYKNYKKAHSMVTW